MSEVKMKQHELQCSVQQVLGTLEMKASLHRNSAGVGDERVREGLAAGEGSISGGTASGRQMQTSSPACPRHWKTRPMPSSSPFFEDAHSSLSSPGRSRN